MILLFVALLAIGKVTPPPAISLDLGPGPFFTKENTADIGGRVTPKGPPYLIKATVNDKDVTFEAHRDGTFSLPVALQAGANTVRLKVIATAANQESPPVEVSIQSGRLVPGAVDITTSFDLFERACALNRGGDPDEEIEAFTKMIESDPLASAGFSGRAAGYIRKDDMKRAFEDATRAVELDPRDFVGWSHRIHYLMEQEKFEEVITSATRSIELDPTLVVSLANRARARLALKKYEDAIADATRAIKLAREPFAYRVRAAAYEATGQFREAIDDYTTLVTLDAENAHSYYNSAAWLLYKKGDPDGALADATSSIELKPTPFAYGTRAWARNAKGDSSGALDDLEKAKALDPSYYGMDVDQGLAEFIRSNDARAVELWEKALASDASNTAAVTPLLTKARQRLAQKRP